MKVSVPNGTRGTQRLTGPEVTQSTARPSLERERRRAAVPANSSGVRRVLGGTALEGASAQRLADPVVALPPSRGPRQLSARIGEPTLSSAAPYDALRCDLSNH